VSAEYNNENNTQEQELWERISTTEGVERAEVLDELSYIAYRRDDFNECLQLVDTSIDIYFKLGMDSHIKELIHAYEGKAFSLRNLDEAKEWQKCLDGHSAAKDSIDPDATPMSMGIDLLNIGMALAKLEQHQAAIESHLSARKLFKEAKNPEYVNWADRYVTVSYAEIGNGPEAKFHAKHYFNYSKVAEDMTMEGFARLSLGKAHLLCQEYEDAERQLVAALEQLTLEEKKPWEEILEANRALAQVLVALGKEEEANTRLERIATIEETICGDDKAA